MSDASDNHMPPDGGVAPNQPVTAPDGTLTRSDGTTPLTDGPSWPRRRRVLWVGIIFCMVVITYSIVYADNSSKVDTAITMSFAMLGSLILGYVFGATYQDVKLWKDGGYS